MPVNIENHMELVRVLVAEGLISAEPPPRCTTLRGGVSNRAVRVELSDGRSWVVKQALEKLRVADDWFSDVSRIQREAEGIRWLARLAPAGSIPELVFELPQFNMLGMQWVPLPHDNLKALLLNGGVPDSQITHHFAALGELLGTVQAGAASCLAEIQVAFADRSFYESLRIEPYYIASIERVPSAGDFIGSLIDRSRTQCSTLVHGDFSPKNVLVTADRLVLLDHEVIHYGDRGFDVGFMLAHILSKAHHLAPRRAAFLDAARTFWQRYRNTTDATDEPLATAHAIGCLLARAVGKSPMDYLSSGERTRQRDVAVQLMSSPPESVHAMIERFATTLDGLE